MLRWLFRLVLYACPPAVRREDGPEMEAVFVHGVETEWARRGRMGRFAACLHGLADAVQFAISARWDARQHRRIAGASQQGIRRPFVVRQNVRAVIRLVRIRPVFAGAIVLMLALGIGATTAIFSVVYGVLLAPLPFPDPDRIVEVWGSRPDRGWDKASLTEANFWDMRDLNHTFAEFGAWHGASAILVTPSGPEQVNAALVSAGFFRALGVRPIVGRLFETGDETPQADRPVLLSHAIWARLYGSDRGIVGKTVAFASGPRLVVGVLPAGTPWLDGGEVFLPFVRRADADRGSFEYAGIGRLRAGVTFDGALSDLRGVASGLERRFPDTNRGLGVVMESSRAWVASDELRRTLWTLLGAVGLLLVIACANVANLLLARSSTRVREIAVRTALGANRADLVRESLTESLVLSVSAAGLGLLVSVALLRAMQALNPGDIPRFADVAVNGWVFAFASGLAILVGVVTGLLPALLAPVSDLMPALRQGQRGAMGDRQQTRVRQAFVIAEVALSLTLLVGAGLLGRSLAQVLTVDRGFQTDHRLFATVAIPVTYGEPRMARTAADLMRRLRGMDEFISVAAVSGRPLSRGSTGLGLAAADSPDSPSAAVPWATWRIVTTDYFHTMGVPLLSGRIFTDAEEFGKPMHTILSKRAASLLWPGQNPIGRTVILWKGQGDRRGEVIGVVGDMRERGLESDTTLAVYFPAGHRATSVLQLVLFTKGQPASAVPALRAAVAAVDRNLPVSDIRSFDDVVSASVSTRRFTMWLLVAFAGLALLLALAGVYGVLAYSVARRTGEIGVRLALGAEHERLLRLVVTQGLRPVLIGMAVGAAATLWLSRLMTSLLFGIQPGDPLTYATASVALITTAAVACYLPARSVLRVDPVVALRAE